MNKLEVTTQMREEYYKLRNDSKVIEWVKIAESNNLYNYYATNDHAIACVYKTLSPDIIKLCMPLEQESYFAFLLLKTFSLLIQYYDNQEVNIKNDIFWYFADFTANFNYSLFNNENSLFKQVGQYKGNKDKTPNKNLIKNELFPRLIAKCITNNEGFYDNKFLYSDVCVPYWNSRDILKQCATISEMIQWYLIQKPYLIINHDNYRHNTITYNVLREFYRFYKKEIDFTSLLGLSFDLSEYTKKGNEKTSVLSASKNEADYINNIKQSNQLYKFIQTITNKFIKSHQ